MRRMAWWTALSLTLVVGAGCGDDDVEQCDGIQPPATLQEGICAGTMRVCVNGEWQEPLYSEIVEGFEVSEFSCDGIDNDCDGVVDDGLGFVYTIDRDGDGFGDSTADASDMILSCDATAPAGYATNSADCDDSDPDIQPNAYEECDGVDNDCDGTVDAGQCHANAHCRDTMSGPICECDAGYQGDGLTCTASGWVALGAGGGHTCGIYEGALYCWGANFDGQLGLGTTEATHIPQQVGTDTDWTAVDAGEDHTCGIRAGQLYCWGNNVLGGSTVYGKLGLGAAYDGVNEATSPVRLGGDADWEVVSAGRSFSCGIRSGELYCWGRGPHGRLGTGDENDRNEPTRVGSDSDWTWVSAGGHATGCGIRAGALYCWGQNVLGGSSSTNPNYGLLGQGATYDGTDFVTSPIQVGTATTWLDVTVGGRSACGIDGGALYCWGRNAHGQLGTGDASDYNTPQHIGIMPDWITVNANQWDGTCGLAGLGELYCWGGNATTNFLGQGSDLSGIAGCDNTLGECWEPVRVGTMNDWIVLDTGGYHGCAVNAGELYCWGDNSTGQSGLDTLDATRTEDPTMIAAP